jgi:hypothetical protein
MVSQHVSAAVAVHHRAAIHHKAYTASKGKMSVHQVAVIPEVW